MALVILETGLTWPYLVFGLTICFKFQKHYFLKCSQRPDTAAINNLCQSFIRSKSY